MMKRTANLLAGVIALVAVSPEAVAGGFDTPVLYSARHIGMGGTGISSAGDPTAIFLNPAGIGRTGFISLTVDFSPILANLDAFPEKDTASSTGIAFAPAFLIGASFRVWDYLTLGLAAYPLASAGATYSYTQKRGTPFNDERVMEDATTIRFIEISPALSFNIPLGPAGNLHIGGGYRVTVSQLNRLKKRTDKELNPELEFDLLGVNFLGFRVGMQWEPTEGLNIGFVYRNQINPEIEADQGFLLGTAATDIKMKLTLPSRLGAGIRYDMDFGEDMGFGVAADYEYAFQSENQDSLIDYNFTKSNGEPGAGQLTSVFRWTDASTVRVGGEFRFMSEWAVRLGYIWDEQVTNPAYSSAFGTPPADTHSATLGFGYESESWEANFAYVYRTGSYEVTEADVKARELVCLTCSYPGVHDLQLYGLYLDFSYHFD